MTNQIIELKKKLDIYADGIRCLFWAWVIRISRNMELIRLPEVVNAGQFNQVVNQKDIETITRIVDFIVKWGARFTGRKCFFRSYILAQLLRKKGIPVKMNMGLTNLSAGKRVRGHCWLSLDNTPICEDTDPHEIYAVKMGESQRQIQYWVGAGNNQVFHLPV